MGGQPEGRKGRAVRRLKTRREGGTRELRQTSQRRRVARPEGGGDGRRRAGTGRGGHLLPVPEGLVHVGLKGFQI